MTATTNSKIEALVRDGEWKRAGVGGVRGVGWEGWGFGTQFSNPQPAPNPKVQLKAEVGGDRGGRWGNIPTPTVVAIIYFNQK